MRFSTFIFIFIFFISKIISVIAKNIYSAVSSGFVEISIKPAILALIDKNLKVFEQIGENIKEYYVLTQRKEVGESVKDLIKENRYQTKVLNEKIMRNREEAEKWIIKNFLLLRTSFFKDPT